MTPETESRNGNAPTEKTSAGETGVNINSNKNGIRLTATAIILHFKPAQCKIIDSHIIINRINIFNTFVSSIFGNYFRYWDSRSWKVTSYIQTFAMVQR